MLHWLVFLHSYRFFECFWGAKMDQVSFGIWLLLVNPYGVDELYSCSGTHSIRGSSGILGHFVVRGPEKHEKMTVGKRFWVVGAQQTTNRNRRGFAGVQISSAVLWKHAVPETQPKSLQIFNDNWTAVFFCFCSSCVVVLEWWCPFEKPFLFCRSSCLARHMPFVQPNPPKKKEHIHTPTRKRENNRGGGGGWGWPPPHFKARRQKGLLQDPFCYCLTLSRTTPLCFFCLLWTLFLWLQHWCTRERNNPKNVLRQVRGSNQRS